MNELVQDISAVSATPVPITLKGEGEIKVIEARAETNADARDQEKPERQSVEDLKKTIDKMAEMAFEGSRLNIEQHTGAGVFVYRLIDQENGSVVRQWPSEDLISLREYLRTQQGGLVDERV